MQTQLHRCSIEVRGYELDGYGHVNHANYLNYLEHARWKILDQQGITDQKMEQWQRWPVIAEAQLRYLKPCFRGDVLEVETRLSAHTRTSLEIEHKVQRQGQAVLEAKLRIVIVNEQGRPAQIPDEFLKAWASEASQ